MADITLKQLAMKLGQSLEDTARAFKVGLYSGIIQDTIVDTGRLKGNWQATDNTPATGVIDRLDPEGDETIRDMERNITPIGVSYLTNNLPYAGKIEERDGMVASNIERVERNIKEDMNA